MIKGIGTDIIEIQRIYQAINRNKEFLNKAFTKKELTYFESKKMNCQHIAGNFAAKEAVAKALGTGFRGFALKDIEIERDELGKPYVNLKEKAEKLVEGFGKYIIHLSISHNKENAVAYAILEVI